MPEPLDSRILRVFDSSNKVVGGAFLLTDRLVVTCAHVVRDAVGLLDYSLLTKDAVLMDFPLTSPGVLFPTKLINWFPPTVEGDGDIAILETVQTTFQREPINLITNEDVVWKHEFSAYGFPEGIDIGTWTTGRILGKGKCGWIQVEGTNPISYPVVSGFSGTPVWDDHAKAVFGIIVAVDTNPYSHNAFVIPFREIYDKFPKIIDGSIPLCPYRGLAPFREQDEMLFFGRDNFIVRLNNLVHKQPLIAVVVGTSGSGKSSVVHAGLFPALKKDGKWLIAHCTPTDKPFLSVAIALAPLLINDIGKLDEYIYGTAPKMAKNLEDGLLQLKTIINQVLIKEASFGCRLLLFIDQFEELFSLCDDPLMSSQFLRNIIDTVASQTGFAQPRISILFTIRVDFMDRVLSHPLFIDALQDSHLLLGPLSSDDMRKVIETPAHMNGVVFEEGLVDKIIEDVGTEAGSLPLLEFALERLWTMQNCRTITFSSYKAIGQVKGALSLYAEQEYQKLNEYEKVIARQIFTQLVVPSNEGQDTKRPATRSELEENGWTLAQKLSKTRLVVIGIDSAKRQIVTLAHEALISSWPRLKEWINIDRDFRSWQERLRFKIGDWRDNNLADDSLLRGIHLADAESWLQEKGNRISVEEKTFIEKSIFLRNKEQRAREKRRSQTILSLSIGLIITLLLAGFSFFQWGQANIQKHIAFSRELAAASISNLKVDPELSILLALHSIQVTESMKHPTLLESEEALRNAVQTSRAKYTFFGNRVAYSPDGAKLAIGQNDYSIAIIEAATGNIIDEFPAHKEEITAIAYSYEGNRLVSGSNDGEVILWDLETRQKLHVINEGIGRITSVEFSPDGKYLGFAGEKGIAILFNAITNNLTTFEHEDYVYDIAFDPSGLRIATASYDRRVRIWNIINEQEIISIETRSRAMTGVDFSPDGKNLALSSYDRSVTIVDSVTGREELVLNSHENVVMDVNYSKNGAYLASASIDGQAIVWNALNGQVWATLAGHKKGIYQVIFSPDNEHVATASFDGTIKVWDITPSHELFALTGHSDEIFAIEYSHGGKYIATASKDRTAILWDSKSGRQLNLMNDHTDRVLDIIFSPDDKQIVTSSADNSVILWDVLTGDKINILVGHKSWVCGVAYSPIGDRIVTSSYDKTSIIWEVPSGKKLFTLDDHTDFVCALSFSPDGSKIATAGYDGKVIIYDTYSGKIIQEFTTANERLFHITYSPRGDLIAVNGTEGFVEIFQSSSWNLVATLPRQTEVITGIDFSPDQSRIAYSTSNKIRIYSFNSKSEGTSFTNHWDRITGISFSPDGKYLASSNADTTAQVFVIEISDLVNLAKTRVTRSVTPEECMKYFHSGKCDSPLNP